MLGEKISNKQLKIILVAIGVVVLLGVIGGGYYYWTGTPEYSITQIRKAVETHNSELGLKYIDTDAVFENFWTDMKSELMGETSGAEGAEGFEGLGMMFGLQLAESMKPAIKEQVEQGVESWFSMPIEKSEETTSTKEDLETGTFWQKDLEMKKQGNSAYLELSDNVKIILTKKEGERYWVISKIEGFTEMVSNDEDIEKEANIYIAEEEEKVKREYIKDNLILENIRVWRPYKSRRIKGVIKNNGSKILNQVEITIYFLNDESKRIGEESYNPVLVTEYSFTGKNNPLKPNYLEDFEYVIEDDAPSEWTGKVEVEITDIDFQE